MTIKAPLDIATSARFLAQLTREVLRKLYGFAEHLCAFYGVQRGSGRTVCSARALEPKELVGETIARVLNGDRTWKQDVAVTAYMEMTMKSILEDRLHQVGVSTRTTTKAPDAMINVVGTDEVEQEARARSLEALEEVLEILEEDGDARAYALCFWLKTDKRSEIADELGWSTWKVDAVRRRVFAALREAKWSLVP